VEGRKARRRRKRKEVSFGAGEKRKRIGTRRIGSYKGRRSRRKCSAGRGKQSEGGRKGGRDDSGNLLEWPCAFS